MSNSKQTVYYQTIQNSLGDSYLQFQINQQTTAVLSVAHTQEAIIVPIEAVTSMPNMPACILGLMNWRSRVIWVIDLPKMFNLEGLDHRLRKYNIIVTKVESKLLGLVVQEIKGTTKLMADDIHSPVGQVAASLVPYLCGCVEQKEEILLVLDAHNIVNYSHGGSD
ncbi:MAG: chemotaxis protein CheW [Sphaerospermopsis sp.]|jgi:positive phototaxis protein PixI|uniref:CheW protein n=3 Tax=Sphaerospermopsis TaxID=752201 RepID=A0A480A144_9CYAN|nr:MULTISPECIES: chemotaxis protein CheW [Sphaerospermopsis]MEB3150063.1 chemotaxis protein CheW [Sphaerospermopsis sp.]BAZ82128.1 CheW protein [Sphaerospermopsis kisseleviana NIES-73]MBC5797509.1 purine-binding chemotaxis protein CheW [Sphaerospermopsis sp. LEGE 00249]MBD2131156.1 purine-binding chemotaxis protein CheW [Sphaerospermopsis sp. FACHB-1094]MBD2145092.1 purine-binding chemotaxis protein CheW [Sphaerospermopsis sp. FACHB-1194]